MIDKSIMKKLLLTFLSIAAAYCSLYAQREVTQERMEQIYEEVKTPYKYDLLLPRPTIIIRSIVLLSFVRETSG